MTHDLLQVHDPVVGHPSIITQSRTQWHSMHEAKMTIHHLGPGEFRRRVHCQPMEAVRPQRVTEQSGVVGSWSLEEKVKMSKPKKKKSVKITITSRRDLLTTNTSPVDTSLSTTNQASFCPPILARWPRVMVNQPAETRQTTWRQQEVKNSVCFFFLFCSLYTSIHWLSTRGSQAKHGPLNHPIWPATGSQMT